VKVGNIQSYMMSLGHNVHLLQRSGYRCKNELVAVKVEKHSLVTSVSLRNTALV